jgi:cell division septum initiation protein DivIVA
MDTSAAEAVMTGVEMVSLIASIASLILAVGAIWLSIVFFKMSNEASKATTEAAKGIDASVKRLENLFDKLYSDTFSMMKDTVSDMRKHIWSGEENGVSGENDKSDILEEADKKAEEKVQEIKSSLDKQLGEILKRQQIADGKVSGIGKELESLLENAIQTSRMVESEAREETVRNHILMELRKLRRRRRTVIADELVDSLREFIPTHRIVRELEGMKEDGLLYFDGERIEPDTKIRLLSIKERTHETES